MTDIRDADLFQVVDSPHKRTVSWEHLKEQIAEALIAEGFSVDGSPGPLDYIEESLVAANFAPAGTAGTYQLAVAQTIPVGARIAFAQVLVTAGFTGDVSCTLTIGDGTDVDRYHTGTLDIFTTAANGVQTGVPSGALFILTANRPTLIFTSATDAELVTAGPGALTVRVFFHRTV